MFNQTYEGEIDTKNEYDTFDLIRLFGPSEWPACGISRLLSCHC